MSETSTVRRPDHTLALPAKTFLATLLGAILTASTGCTISPTPTTVVEPDEAKVRYCFYEGKSYSVSSYKKHEDGWLHHCEPGGRWKRVRKV